MLMNRRTAVCTSKGLLLKDEKERTTNLEIIMLSERSQTLPPQKKKEHAV